MNTEGLTATVAPSKVLVDMRNVYLGYPPPTAAGRALDQMFKSEPAKFIDRLQKMESELTLSAVKQADTNLTPGISEMLKAGQPCPVCSRVYYDASKDVGSEKAREALLGWLEANK